MARRAESTLTVSRVSRLVGYCNPRCVAIVRSYDDMHGVGGEVLRVVQVYTSTLLGFLLPVVSTRCRIHRVYSF